jgi:hypothetical protein
MKFKRYRNWWGETLRQEYERRINALEAHIQDLSTRVSKLEFLPQKANQEKSEKLIKKGDYPYNKGDYTA